MDNDNYIDHEYAILVKTKIIDILSNLGIIVDFDIANNEDVNLNDYNVNSLTLVSFFVDIEKEFDIYIPDEYLRFETLQSLNGFFTLIISLIENSNKQNASEMGDFILKN